MYNKIDTVHILDKLHDVMQLGPTLKNIHDHFTQKSESTCIHVYM